MEDGPYPIQVPSGTHTWGQSPLVSTLIFVLVVVWLNTAVSRKLPVPESFREKFAYFAEHKDEFDVLFFGASETHWGISPEHFDDQLRSHGLELRSYNLAAPGSGGFEIDHLIRSVLKMRPERLRWVVIAWRPWRLERDALFHERQVWWHSPVQTTRVFQLIVFENLPARARWEYARSHTRDALYKFFNLGIGPKWLAALRNPPGPGRGKWDYLARTGGFEGLSPEKAEIFWPQGVAVRERFLEEQDAFVERTVAQALRMKELRSGSERDAPAYLATLFPGTVYASEAQVAYLRMQGLEPVYLVPPSHEPDTIPRRLWEEGYLPALMAFNDPNEYPELFELRYRYDPLHLTEEGAALYSRRAADRFAEYLRTGTKSGR
jgi:hypothetical protein